MKPFGRRIVTRAFISGTCCAALTTLASAEVWHVYPGESIQTAINDADHGDEIEIHPGHYVETINLLGKEITVRSTDPTDPDVIAATVIDANSAGSVVTCTSGTDATVLTGLVLTGGYAQRGGGMYILNANPTVTACTFIDNRATQMGAGMYINLGTPHVSNCAFFANRTIINTSDLGGGLCLNDSDALIEHCTFIGNRTEGHGGGIFTVYGNPHITDCSISANHAVGLGGGIASSSSGGNPTLTACAVIGNVPAPVTGPYTDGGGNLLLHYPSPPLPEPEPEPTGGCCIQGVCIPSTESICLNANGTYLGDDTECAMVPCPDRCPEDLADPVGVEQQDLNAVLNRWGDPECELVPWRGEGTGPARIR